MEKKAKVNNRIRAIRRERGWTVYELTIRFQLEQNREFFESNLDFIREAEAGAVVDGMELIARALGVTVDYLQIR